MGNAKQGKEAALQFGHQVIWVFGSTGPSLPQRCLFQSRLVLAQHFCLSSQVSCQAILHEHIVPCITFRVPDPNCQRYSKKQNCTTCVGICYTSIGVQYSIQIDITHSISVFTFFFKIRVIQGHVGYKYECIFGLSQLYLCVEYWMRQRRTMLVTDISFDIE
jgi:hypothetical protein